MGSNICTEETKQKIRKALLGVPHTEERKKKESISHQGKTIPEGTKIKMSNSSPHYWKGRKRSIESKDKMSKAHKGKTSNRKGIVLTDNEKRKMREAAIRRLKRNGGFSLSIGRQEKQILDTYEKLHCVKIKRQFLVVGYFIDGYIPELNLAIEIDESHHFKIDGTLKEHDIKRQQEIEKELGCKFIRIKVKEIPSLLESDFQKYYVAMNELLLKELEL
jgi:very-short-patch-repair endonuclease